jgi:hypothetical protein
MPRAAASLGLLLAAATAARAQPGWRILAKDIGGAPLGVAFFADGLNGITETSHILPFPGYETEESLDGGATWKQVPDQDGVFGVLALYNVAVAGDNAVVSAEASIQFSTDRGHNFSAATGPAGGEIVRKLMGADGATAVGFAILGETTDGNTVGLVASYDGGRTWTPNNIGELDPGILSIDGAFANASWTVVGNEYVTAAATAVGGPLQRRERARSRIHLALRARMQAARRAAATTASGGNDSAESALRGAGVGAGAAEYHTQVVTSSDAGATWTTVYRNNSVAALGIACSDHAQRNCCFVGEDADFSYIYCTRDGWKTTRQVLADTNEGAALVEVAVTVSANATCFVAAGGYVLPSGGQDPVFYRSCDNGDSWAKDPLPSWPVANLLATDIDCQPAITDGSGCWATLWDNGGIIVPNGFVARYYPS